MFRHILTLVVFSLVNISCRDGDIDLSRRKESKANPASPSSDADVNAAEASFKINDSSSKPFLNSDEIQAQDLTPPPIESKLVLSELRESLHLGAIDAKASLNKVAADCIATMISRASPKIVGDQLVLSISGNFADCVNEQKNLDTAESMMKFDRIFIRYYLAMSCEGADFSNLDVAGLFKWSSARAYLDQCPDAKKITLQVQSDYDYQLTISAAKKITGKQSVIWQQENGDPCKIERNGSTDTFKSPCIKVVRKTEDDRMQMFKRVSVPADLIEEKGQAISKGGTVNFKLNNWEGTVNLTTPSPMVNATSLDNQQFVGSL